MDNDDTRTLKRKVDAIITNINIYKRDLDKEMAKLKQMGIDELADIDETYKEIESRIKSLDKRKEKLLKRAKQMLKGIDNA